jgi:cytochrome c oxidase subunit 1
MSTIGAFVIALSILVFLVNAVMTRTRGLEAGADPWDARTLEWATTSPPPEYNFEEIPIVRHRDDFWHRKYIETPEGEPARVFAGGAVATHEHEAGHGIHMPSPSYFPLVASLGLPLLGYGVIYFNSTGKLLLVAGALVTLLGLFGWVLEPGAEEV